MDNPSKNFSQCVVVKSPGTVFLAGVQLIQVNCQSLCPKNFKRKYAQATVTQTAASVWTFFFFFCRL